MAITSTNPRRPPPTKVSARPAASSAAERASSSRRSETAAQAASGRSASTLAGRVYVEAVLDRYLWLPGTPARSSRHDRRLARSLYERGVPLHVVLGALLLATARRSFRSRDLPPLPPIRSMHYFLPLVEEILKEPFVPGYAEYLEHKLWPLAEAKAAAARIETSPPTPGRNE